MTDRLTDIIAQQSATGEQIELPDKVQGKKYGNWYD